MADATPYTPGWARVRGEDVSPRSPLRSTPRTGRATGNSPGAGHVAEARGGVGTGAGRGAGAGAMGAVQSSASAVGEALREDPAFMNDVNVLFQNAVLSSAERQVRAGRAWFCGLWFDLVVCGCSCPQGWVPVRDA